MSSVNLPNVRSLPATRLDPAKQPGKTPLAQPLARLDLQRSGFDSAKAPNANLLGARDLPPPGGSTAMLAMPTFRMSAGVSGLVQVSAPLTSSASFAATAANSDAPAGAAPPLTSGGVTGGTETPPKKYSAEWFMTQENPSQAAREYVASKQKQVYKTIVDGKSTAATPGAIAEQRAARDVQHQVEALVSQASKAEAAKRKEADAALGGKHSLTWFMAQPDPVKSAESWVRGLKNTQDKAPAFRGQGEQIAYAKAMVEIVKSTAAGETPTPEALKRLNDAKGRMEHAFDIGAKYKTTKNASPANARKVQEAYEKDLKAWQDHAVSVGGIRANGGDGVRAPTGMSPDKFRALIGPAPRFSDYEKGGPKYPLGNKPPPEPVVLSGSNTSGSFQLEGRVEIRAAGASAWTARPNASGKKYELVLEGNSADWSVRTNANTATYINNVTKTSVTIPASEQKHVSYA